jgi:hypothetical protein
MPGPGGGRGTLRIAIAQARADDRHRESARLGGPAANEKIFAQPSTAETATSWTPRFPPARAPLAEQHGHVTAICASKRTGHSRSSSR